MDVGAKLPHTGPAAHRPGIVDGAVTLERAGIASAWVSDHVVLPREVSSWYPFEPDGVARWRTDVDYAEAVVVLAAAAAATTRLRLGTAVLVLPQREPLLLAKQLATVDALAPGRLAIGVGAGWLAEEFAALGAGFADRGRRMVPWMTLMREAWSGSVTAPGPGVHPLEHDVVTLPAPAVPIPLYPGGHSPAALRRAGRHGDGWLAQHDLAALEESLLAHEIEVVRSHAEQAAKDPAALRVVLRIAGSQGRVDDVARRLPALAAIGVDEVIVDLDLDDDPERDAARLLDAASGASG